MGSSETGNIEWKAPWQPVTDQSLVVELQKEINSGHVLAGKKVSAIGRRTDSDDVLFQVLGASKPFAVVHLTWKGKEKSSQWPATSFYSTVEECFVAG